MLADIVGQMDGSGALLCRKLSVKHHHLRPSLAAQRSKAIEKSSKRAMWHNDAMNALPSEVRWIVVVCILVVSWLILSLQTSPQRVDTVAVIFTFGYNHLRGNAEATPAENPQQIVQRSRSFCRSSTLFRQCSVDF